MIQQLATVWISLTEFSKWTHHFQAYIINWLCENVFFYDIQ